MSAVVQGCLHWKLEVHNKCLWTPFLMMIKPRMCVLNSGSFQRKSVIVAEWTKGSLRRTGFFPCQWDAAGFWDASAVVIRQIQLESAYCLATCLKHNFRWQKMRHGYLAKCIFAYVIIGIIMLMGMLLILTFQSMVEKKAWRLISSTRSGPAPVTNQESKAF